MSETPKIFKELGSQAQQPCSSEIGSSTSTMSESEPTNPSTEELMDQLGPDRIDMMRSMMDVTYKPGEEEDGAATKQD